MGASSGGRSCGSQTSKHGADIDGGAPGAASQETHYQRRHVKYLEVRLEQYQEFVVDFSCWWSVRCCCR
jgi:hypothetical protein